jgi:molybdopterin-containing oxidoreductase family iron-sulfur binding subunit
LNALLDNLGKAIELRKPPDRPASGSLQDLIASIDRNEVETLLILGANPGYSAPADLGFADRLKRVPTTIRLGLHADETSRLATWHLPMAHDLEAWGDARAGDGTLLAIQPMIEPLFGGRNQLEELARLSNYQPSSAYEIVRRAFRQESGVDDASFEVKWRRFLHEGTWAVRGYPVVQPAIRWEALARAVRSYQPTEEPLSAANLELVLERDAKVDDGRFANNGWLQELPSPITKLTWGNAALLSPATARELGVRDGDLVRLELDGRSLEIAVMIIPGQADFSVGVSLGYGRTACGHVGREVGFNAYTLRTTRAQDVAIGLKLQKVERRSTLATTQDHHTMEGHDLVRELTLEDLVANPATQQGHAVEYPDSPSS